MGPFKFIMAIFIVHLYHICVILIEDRYCQLVLYLDSFCDGSNTIALTMYVIIRESCIWATAYLIVVVKVHYCRTDDLGYSFVR
jgi:hypothetical protein